MPGKSKNRLFSQFIRQINSDLTIQTTALETEAQVTTTTVSDQIDSAVTSLSLDFDSADVLGLIDSAYINARSPAFDGDFAAGETLRFGPEVYAAPSLTRGSSLDTYVSYSSSTSGILESITSSVVSALSVGDYIWIYQSASYPAACDAAFEITQIVSSSSVKVSTTSVDGNTSLPGPTQFEIFEVASSGGTSIPLSISYDSSADTIKFTSNRTVEISSAVTLGSNNITAANLTVTDSVGVTGLIDSAYIAARSSGGGGGGGGVTTYSAIANLPSSGNSTGDLAYVTDNASLYLWKGSVWFKILTATSPNTTPFFTSQPKASYALATDGTPLSLEFTATDPEGTPINWNYSVTDGTLGSIATIVNDSDGSFTITPSTNSANTGFFELTFTASDGVNIANSRPVRLSLLFNLDWGSATLQTTLLAPVDGAAGKFGNSTSTYGYKVAVTEPLYDAGGAFGKYDHGKLYIYDMTDMENPVEELSWSPGDDDSSGAIFNSGTTGCKMGDKVVLHDNICFVGTATSNNQSGVFVFRYDSAWSFDQFLHANNTYQTDFAYDPGTKRLCVGDGNDLFFFHESDGSYIQKGSVVAPTNVDGVAIKDDFALCGTGSGDDVMLAYWDSTNQQWSEIDQLNGSPIIDITTGEIVKFGDQYTALVHKNHTLEGGMLKISIDKDALTFSGSPVSVQSAVINGAGSGTNVSYDAAGIRDYIAVYQTAEHVKILGGNGKASSAKLNLITLDSTMSILSDSDIIDYPAHNPVSWGMNLSFDPITGIIVTGSPEEDVNDGRVYVYRI